MGLFSGYSSSYPHADILATERSKARSIAATDRKEVNRVSSKTKDMAVKEYKDTRQEVLGEETISGIRGSAKRNIQRRLNEDLEDIELERMSNLRNVNAIMAQNLARSYGAQAQLQGQYEQWKMQQEAADRAAIWSTVGMIAGMAIGGPAGAAIGAQAGNIAASQTN